MPALITLGDIRRKLGNVSRQRADEISRRKTFPDPVGTAGGYRLWDEDAVDAWITRYRTPRDQDDPPEQGDDQG